jgi:hypothetical protein
VNVLQVHGVGPFSIQFVDPVYELTDTGVVVRTTLGQPGKPAPSIPPDCFGLKMGAPVRCSSGEGVVVGAFCSPANRLNLYWVSKPTGGRFWAPREDLTAP